MNCPPYFDLFLCIWRAGVLRVSHHVSIADHLITVQYKSRLTLIFLSTLISGKIVASPVMEHIFHGIKHFTLKGHCSQTTYSLGTIIVDQSCYPWVVSYSYPPPPVNANFKQNK